MKAILIALIVLMGIDSFGQLNTTHGITTDSEIEVYLVEYNGRRDAHKIAIDTGSNNEYSLVLDEENKVVYIQSPVQLKRYMASKGYIYIRMESYITRLPDENWYSVRYFEFK